MGPDNGPGRGAVRAGNSKRKTNQVVDGGLHTFEVQTLQNPDAGAKQDSVSFGAVGFPSADRKVINADQADAETGEVSCSRGRERGEVWMELLAIPGNLRVSGF